MYLVATMSVKDPEVEVCGLLFGTHEGVCSEIGYARLCIHQPGTIRRYLLCTRRRASTRLRLFREIEI
jgi:hypothetical protein